MRKIATILSFILVLLAGTSIANASSINYIFQATGTGSLGGTQFSNASFTLTVVGDTDNVQNEGGGLFLNAATSAQIAIQGFQVADFTTLVGMFDYQPGNALGLQRAPQMADILDLSDPAFSSYDLTTPIGPLLVANPFIGQFNCDRGCIETSQGELEFTDMSSVTFSATTVPEPGTLVLVGAGVLGLVGRLRQKVKL